jgi:hypothetical protein
MAANVTDRVLTVEALGDGNYATWRVRMKAFLITKRLWAAVEGTDLDAGRDEQALAFIQLHVSNNILPLIETCDSAKDAWEQLETVYKNKGNARCLQLRKELANLKMEKTETLAVYFARAKKIWTDLLALGHTLEETDVVWNILAGLHQDYETVVTILTTGEDTLDLNNVLAKLLPVEKTLQAKNEVEVYWARVNQSGKFRGGSNFDKKCWACGEKGHLKKDCKNRDRYESHFAAHL